MALGVTNHNQKDLRKIVIMSELSYMTQRFEAFAEGYRTSGDMENMTAQS